MKTTEGRKTNTMIELGRFQKNTAETLCAKLESLAGSCFWRPEFISCPDGGECQVWAQTDYDFATDYDGEPQDAEKAFGLSMLHLLVSAIALG